MDDAKPAPALQRARGSAGAVLQRVGETTRLRRLRQEGCLKLRFPRVAAGPLEAVTINTAGGLTGGDRIDLSLALEAGTQASVTTQAAERVYRARDGAAEVTNRIEMAPGASLSWLPQETILFEGGRLRRRLELDCTADGRFLLCEAVLLGRAAMGESVATGLYRDSWRVRRDGRLVFAEEMRLEGDLAATIASPAGLYGAGAFATVLWQSEGGAERVENLRAMAGPLGGVSAFDGLLVARLLAPSGLDLRARLVPLLRALSNTGLPRLWWL
ncbi:urease accessory protein UreD [Aurantimonas sp. Leaf443]|uniref:urease accessory protein UreD n=1 Tax=Aurantimonas sp. Leaf443 TaxID=1736378 RepID=UPI0007009311|nr:urease accessory protein UreD [Aurantimonas sp. Leaf443]KQT85210.1 hypothetical protein ASG48_08065 [Aurantimonas sp. Leaf443]